VMDWISWILGFVLVLLVGLVVFGSFFVPRPKALKDCKGKHVFITGGSTGLGKSLASKFAKMGANITIVARNEQKLEEARKDIESVCTFPNQKVISVSADVTKFADIERAVQIAVKGNGVTDIVIANAGNSVPGYFLDQTPEALAHEVNLNYLGVVYTVKAALPFMVERKKGGHFVLVSSAAAFINFLGYTNYGSTKRALAALAEGLRNELKLYNIDVSIFFPTGIDTEGFQNENKTKPEETKVMEGPSSTLSPDVVADSLIQGLQKGKFSITNEILTELMRVSSQGFLSPRQFLPFDMVLTFLMLLITGPFIFYFDWVVSHSKRRQRSDY